MSMIVNEGIDFCINRFLQHFSGPLPDDLIEGTSIIELLSECDYS